MAETKKKAVKSVGAKKVTKTTVKPKAKTVRAEKLVEAPVVDANAHDHKSEKPKYGGNGFSGTSGWTAYRLVDTAEKLFTNPVGTRIMVRAELRIPNDRGFLRFVVGRDDQRSPVGLSRQGFYEDLPYYIEALIDLYEKGIEPYIVMETARIRRRIDHDLDEIEKVVTRNPDVWRVKLLEYRKALRDELPGGDSDKSD